VDSRHFQRVATMPPGSLKTEITVSTAAQSGISNELESIDYPEI